jgi:hypothetical protein
MYEKNVGKQLKWCSWIKITIYKNVCEINHDQFDWCDVIFSSKVVKSNEMSDLHITYVQGAQHCSRYFEEQYTCILLQVS